MIRNIVFDMGNVLIEWDPDRIVARQNLHGEDAKRLRREVFDCVEWVSMDRGTMSQDEGLARILRRLPPELHGAAERCVRDWWKDELRHIEGMETLIREISALGYPIYLLSNATSFLHDYFHRLPAANCFSGMLVSADWGLLKPQHEIFETFFDRFSLRPEECFFIDDSPVNIDGAAVAGMAGTVFFRDMARLRRDLIAAGIPVRETAP